MIVAMAPLFLLLLLFGIVVTAQNNQGIIGDIPLHPAGQRNEKRQEEQQQSQYPTHPASRSVPVYHSG